MRKTKIICTLGPAVDDEETLRKLILGGMNAARFNFSHGTHESHLAQLTKLKRVRDNLGAPVATILDTKGPEIRVKTFENSPVTLEWGQTFVLCTDDVPGDQNQVSVTYQNLHNEVGPGCRILVDDGLIELKVERIEGKRVVCQVENGGPLSSNKSINIPDVHIHLPSLTDKDREDIRFAVENDFDFIAASFVRKASDVEERSTSSPRSRTGRAWTTSTPSLMPPTASWWPVATWGWRSPPMRCPSSRSRSSRQLPGRVCPLLPPLRCWTP